MIGQDPERQAPSGDLPDPATGDGRDSVTALVIGATDVTELTLRARGFARARESIGCITGPAADTSASEDPPVVLVQADSGSAASMQQVLAISDSFGIIIDGGAGGPLAVIEAFAQYWTHLAGDGTYVIDQLDCANPASAKDTALQTLSIVGFVKRLWDVAHLNQCSGAASRAALLAPFSETIGIEFREDELRRILDVELGNAMRHPQGARYGGALRPYPFTGFCARRGRQCMR